MVAGDEYRDEFMASLGTVTPATPQIAIISSTLGNWTHSLAFDAEHWWRHFRQPVRFASAMDALVADSHSLLAVELAARMGESIGIRLAVAEIFNHPTIEQLASVIQASRDLRSVVV